MPKPDIDDRSGELQALIDPEIRYLEFVFEQLQYTEDEIGFAMLAVVLARMKMREANMDTDEAIARALKAIEGE